MRRRTAMLVAMAAASAWIAGCSKHEGAAMTTFSDEATVADLLRMFREREPEFRREPEARPVAARRRAWPGLHVGPARARAPRRPHRDRDLRPNALRSRVRAA